MSYDTEHVGEIYAVNVPNNQNWDKLSLEDAKEIVSEYRWIYANASCKDLYEAKDEATKLSNAVGRPMVLVYMPKNVFDGTRNEYPGKFQASMHALIERALADKKELLVTARSYAVHQALRAVRKFDSPLILLIGIAPAFGAFGNIWSDNVKRYIEDVEQTRSRYFMIASNLDEHTWMAGGAVERKSVGYIGDFRVGKAMDRNKKNVDYFVLHGAHHFPIDEYLHHGLVDAMQKGAHHWGYDNTPIGDIVYGRKNYEKEDLPPISEDELTKTVWQFGLSDGSTIAERIRLLPGGGIGGYSNPHESSWKIEGRHLILYDINGKAATRFDSFKKHDGRWVISGPFLLYGNAIHVIKEIS